MHQGVSASLSEGPAGPLDNHSAFAGKAVASLHGSYDPHIRLSSVDPRKLAPTLLTTWQTLTCQSVGAGVAQSVSSP